jgi:hypothetical protein
MLCRPFASRFLIAPIPKFPIGVSPVDTRTPFFRI